jgi:hypothetical protein
VKPANPKKLAFIVPGDPEKSDVWRRAGKAPYGMPKDYAERQPNDEERKILERWIRARAAVAAPISGGVIRNSLPDCAELMSRPGDRSSGRPTSPAPARGPYPAARPGTPPAAAGSTRAWHDAIGR